jgi:hypothetical protein
MKKFNSEKYQSYLYGGIFEILLMRKYSTEF